MQYSTQVRVQCDNLAKVSVNKASSRKVAFHDCMLYNNCDASLHVLYIYISIDYRTLLIHSWPILADLKYYKHSPIVENHTSLHMCFIVYPRNILYKKAWTFHTLYVKFIQEGLQKIGTVAEG